MNTHKKYYYADPLAAAWMAKHFGMKFDVDYGAGEKTLDRYHEIAILSVPPKIPALKFFIPPDNLHILEPQEGDLAQHNNVFSKCKKGGKQFGIMLTHNKHFVIGGDEPSLNISEPQEINVKIIQRNGIPFMWPEIEA